MEGSVKSMSKARIEDNSPEESGWTIYFEDFLSNKDEYMASFASGTNGSSSMVSDAYSSAAANKLVDTDKVAERYPLQKSCRNLSFKKRKTNGVLVDDALEDTASSPVSSPKVCNLSQLDMRPKERDYIEISQGKGSISEHTNEKNDLGFIGKDSDCTELKKRGLCLVPLSMFVNHLG